MFTRIVVGIDFSIASREALASGAKLAQALHVPLVGVHVVETSRPPFYAAYAPLGDPGWFKDVEPRIQEKLAEWLAPFPSAQAKVLSGNPGDVLAAEAEPGALLVVGEVGHSVLEHMLFGSTATRVAHHAACAVLIVRGRRRTGRAQEAG